MAENYGTDESAAWVKQYPIGSTVFLAKTVRNKSYEKVEVLPYKVTSHTWCRPNDVASNQWSMGLTSILNTRLKTKVYYCDRENVGANRKTVIKHFKNQMRKELKNLELEVRKLKVKIAQTK